MVNYYSERRRFLKFLMGILKQKEPISIKKLALLVMEKFGYSENTLRKTIDLMEEGAYISINGDNIYWNFNKK